MNCRFGRSLSRNGNSFLAELSWRWLRLPAEMAVLNNDNRDVAIGRPFPSAVRDTRAAWSRGCAVRAGVWCLEREVWRGWLGMGGEWAGNGRGILCAWRGRRETPRAGARKPKARRPAVLNVNDLPSCELNVSHNLNNA